MPEMTPGNFGSFVRTVTRPVLTIIGLLSWIFFIKWGTEYPPAFQWLTLAMCLEWFAERGLSRFGEMMKPK